MTTPLAPKLKPRMVRPETLILDPNNPRFIQHDKDIVPDERLLDSDIAEQTFERMKVETFKVKELKESIRQNGFVPVDSIFVRKHKDSDKFVVLEGNRRVSAIRELLKEEDLRKGLRDSLKTIEVQEVVGSGDEELLQQQITYLLGVRHHGSLKKWSPFSQANNIFKRYSEYGGSGGEHFKWDPAVGCKVADALSIGCPEVEERLRVFVAMQQLSAHPTVKAVGGLKHRDYSIISDAINAKKLQLREYFAQDSESFRLSPDGIARFDNLCAFSRAREDAIVPVPSEWSDFAKILSDEDQQKRTEMLQNVESDHKRPSLVWARRAEELAKIEWESWLEKVNDAVSGISLGDSFDTAAAEQAVQGLATVLDKLDKRDQQN